MASKNLSGVEYINIDLYADRTGENLFFSIHDTGCATAGFTPNVLTASAWGSYLWDITGMADGDKDLIDTFSIKVVNASAANTFYVDNVFGVFDSSVTATAQSLTLALKAPTVGIGVNVTPSVLALVAAVKEVVVGHSVTVGEGALTLTLYNPTVTISSSVSPTVQTMAMVLEGGVPFLNTRIIRRNYTFGVTEQVTHTKLNNLVDTAIWEISNQETGDMFYFDGTNWMRLPVGTEGQVLTMNASGQPRWA